MRAADSTLLASIAIPRLALSLALGFATSLTIAWTSAFFMPVDQPSWGRRHAVRLHGGWLQPWLVHVHRPTADRTIWFETGRVYFEFAAGPPGGNAAALASRTFALGLGYDARTDGDLVECPEAVRIEVERFPMTVWGGAEDSRGWPLPALRGRVFGAADPNASSIWLASRSVLLPSREKAAASRPSETLGSVRILPLEPIWSGLLIDTAFFTTLWLVMLSIPPRLRRRYRLHRGHCPRCDYDLRATPGALCPECGADPTR